MTAGGGTQVLAGHGSVHGPGHEAVIADSDADVLVYHYYADDGTPLLGINLVGYDASGWPFGEAVEPVPPPQARRCGGDHAVGEPAARTPVADEDAARRVRVRDRALGRQGEEPDLVGAQAGVRGVVGGDQQERRRRRQPRQCPDPPPAYPPPAYPRPLRRFRRFRLGGGCRGGGRGTPPGRPRRLVATAGPDERDGDLQGRQPVAGRRRRQRGRRAVRPPRHRPVVGVTGPFPQHQQVVGERLHRPGPRVRTPPHCRHPSRLVPRKRSRPPFSTCRTLGGQLTGLDLVFLEG
jgi:hypothetical protein